MQRPKVLIAYKAEKFVLDFVGQHCDCELCDESDRQVVLDKVKDVDGLMLGGKTTVDGELLDRASRLRVVSNIAVGYNNFDVEEMKKRNVLATHTPDVLNDTVADLIMGLMLASGRRICELDRLMRQGGWLGPVGEELFGLDINRSCLGIIGMGRIGETVAKRAAAGFGMEVCYCNRHPRESAKMLYNARYMSMDDLLAVADYVVVMTPLTDETRGMIGAREFGIMKRSAVFINASRGPVVDEGALIAALKSGQIRGAGLDVFEQEPISPDNELLKLDNVVLTPHIGSATKRTRDAMAMLAARNLVDGAYERIPENLIPEMK